jgi:outer membrane lipoprotein-sorting protein
MLRKVSLWTATAAFVALAASAQTVDEIVAQNLEARGGIDKIKSVSSATVTGKMTGGPAEVPITMKWKRPKKMRLEFTMQGMTGVQAYDGAVGWSIMPFLGKQDAEPMSAEELKQVEEQADFDGDLVDYKEKGHQLELVGKETLEGTPAWKLKLTKKSGDVTYIYLDAEAFLEIKHEGKRTIRGQEFEIETTFGDYKEVGGLVFAHSIESRPKGAPVGQAIAFDTIELNIEVPDSEFTMPPAKPAAAAQPGG